MITEPQCTVPVRTRPNTVVNTVATNSGPELLLIAGEVSVVLRPVNRLKRPAPKTPAARRGDPHG